LNNENFDLRETFDKEVYPLLLKLTETCNKHKMPMLASVAFSAIDAGTPEESNTMATARVSPDNRSVESYDLAFCLIARDALAGQNFSQVAQSADGAVPVMVPALAAPIKGVA
jgi:hypothetical protein